MRREAALGSKEQGVQQALAEADDRWAALVEKEDEVAFVEYPIALPLLMKMNVTLHGRVQGILARELHLRNSVRVLRNLQRRLLTMRGFHLVDIVLLPLKLGKFLVKDEFYPRE